MCAWSDVGHSKFERVETSHLFILSCFLATAMVVVGLGDHLI